MYQPERLERWKMPRDPVPGRWVGVAALRPQ